VKVRSPQRAVSDEFRQPPGCQTAKRLHLPEPILRHGQAKAKGQIPGCLAIHLRNAGIIAADPHFS
ncbi:MAG TPA: hypothetical protein VN648_34095, partial [Candidatus Methylomirabilis sp.]|nr:hypothetical protein [Candidatus Methylomirabilis sp.]